MSEEIKKILIVEDEAIIALDIKRQLVTRGYEVIGIAKNGVDAIELAITQLPDLILMDINIQGDINGIETSKSISQEVNIPIVFLTAHSDPKTLEEAKDATPYGYLIKPFEERTLYTTIETVIHRHRIEQRLKVVEAEKKKLQEELLQAEKIKSMATLVGGIAHNFNNLLMVIQGTASVMKMDLAKEHPHIKELNNIQATVKKSANLIDQLLLLTQQGRFEFTELDVQSLVRECVDGFLTSNENAHVEIKGILTQFYVEGDRRLLSYVILHLLENGLKSMDYNGELHIIISQTSVSKKSDTDQLLEPGDYIKVTVKDFGEGMDEATRWRIFDPFFTTREVGSGVGLGLSAAYGIVQKHKGLISVTSTPGAGSSFDVYLPEVQKS